MKKQFLLYGSFLCFGLMTAELKAMEMPVAHDQTDQEKQPPEAPITASKDEIAEAKKTCLEAAHADLACQYLLRFVAENRIALQDARDIMAEWKEANPKDTTPDDTINRLLSDENYSEFYRNYVADYHAVPYDVGTLPDALQNAKNQLRPVAVEEE